MMTRTLTTSILFDFSDPQQTSLWQPVNDVIMGGVSTGQMKHCSSGTALFTGVVSLEQGGGFASVRTLPGKYNLRGFSGIQLSIRGDGKLYKINLTDHRTAEGVLFQAQFVTTPGEWVDVRVGFDELQATFRGRRVGGAELQTDSIRTFGLMISGRQAGPFALEVGRIYLYREETTDQPSAD